MALRRRKLQPAESLEEPLLAGEDEREPLREPAPQAGRHERSSSAIVPYSINRVDWAALWSAISGVCRAGWRGVLATISNCWGTFFPEAGAEPPQLSTTQEQRLQALQRRIQQPYDGEDPAHQDALRRLWGHAFPGEAVPEGLRSQRWTDMGWQRDDPASDFRGAGFVALENLLFLAQRRPELFERLLRKSEGERSEWEYPFAAAGVNLSFMLSEVADLRRQHTGAVGHVPSTPAGRAFLALLEDRAELFDELYCLAFESLDRVWLEMRASYMEFPAVMQRLRSQLHDALASRPRSLDGLQVLLRP